MNYVQSKYQATQGNQPKKWSEVELRRVARVFDLLIKIDQRTKRSQDATQAK